MSARARWGNWTGEWRDRVADADEPIEDLGADIERLLGDAVVYAQTIVECTAGPLREVVSGLAASMGFGDWRASQRGTGGHETPPPEGGRA